MPSLKGYRYFRTAMCGTFNLGTCDAEVMHQADFNLGYFQGTVNTLTMLNIRAGFLRDSRHQIKRARSKLENDWVDKVALVDRLAQSFARGPQ